VRGNTATPAFAALRRGRQRRGYKLLIEALLIENRFRRGLAHFKSTIGRTRCGELGAHSLKARCQSFDFLFLFRES
jgi:hypothetical protein